MSASPVSEYRSLEENQVSIYVSALLVSVNTLCLCVVCLSSCTDEKTLVPGRVVRVSSEHYQRVVLDGSSTERDKEQDQERDRCRTFVMAV